MNGLDDNLVFSGRLDWAKRALLAGSYNYKTFRICKKATTSFTLLAEASIFQLVLTASKWQTGAIGATVAVWFACYSLRKVPGWWLAALGASVTAGEALRGLSAAFRVVSCLWQH